MSAGSESGSRVPRSGSSIQELFGAPVDDLLGFFQRHVAGALPAELQVYLLDVEALLRCNDVRRVRIRVEGDGETPLVVSGAKIEQLSVHGSFSLHGTRSAEGVDLDPRVLSLDPLSGRKRRPAVCLLGIVGDGPGRHAADAVDAMLALQPALPLLTARRAFGTHEIDPFLEGAAGPLRKLGDEGGFVFGRCHTLVSDGETGMRSSGEMDRRCRAGAAPGGAAPLAVTARSWCRRW